jgi:hypothetical protein
MQFSPKDIGIEKFSGTADANAHLNYFFGSTCGRKYLKFFEKELRAVFFRPFLKGT